MAKKEKVQLTPEELAEKKLEEIALFREEIHLALTKANCENEITINYVD